MAEGKLESNSSACCALCRRSSSMANAVNATVRARPLLVPFSRTPALVCSVLPTIGSCAALHIST